MNTKKFVAAMLVFTMALGFTACSGGAKKYAKGLEDIDFTEYDYSEAKKFDSDDDELEDGFYTVITDEKDIRKFTKKYFDEQDSDDINCISWGGKITTDKDDYQSYLDFYAIDMKNKEDAEDFFEDVVDAYEDESEDEYFKEYDPEFDSGDDYGIIVYEYEAWGNKHYSYSAVYLDGKTVIFINASGYNKQGKEITELVDEYCENMGLQAPGDI